MHLQFKATTNFLVYHEMEGLYCKDGDIVEVSEAEGNILLADFPKNFFEVKVEEIEAEIEELEKPIVETAPNKMVTEEKPKTQKRKKK